MLGLDIPRARHAPQGLFRTRFQRPALLHAQLALLASSLRSQAQIRRLIARFARTARPHGHMLLPVTTAMRERIRTQLSHFALDAMRASSRLRDRLPALNVKQASGRLHSRRRVGPAFQGSTQPLLQARAHRVQRGSIWQPLADSRKILA